VRSTYKSALDIAPGGLPAPFAQGRPLGTALFFMLTPEAPVKLHRIMNDQLYHYYLGDPIELRLMYENGATERMVVGPDILNGQRVQFFILRGHISYRAHRGRAPLVPGRLDRVARRGSGARRRARRSGETRRGISGSCRGHPHLSQAELARDDCAA